nr:hypothetical protein [uncultured Pseudodesulfovibrio sp.]
MPAAVSDIRALLEQGDALIRDLTGVRGRLPGKAIPKVIIANMYLKAALHICEEQAATVAGRATQDGGMDFSLPNGDR